METTLSKLQKQVTRLEKDNIKLRDLLEAQKLKNESLRNQIKYIEQVMEEKIAKAVKKYEITLIKEIEELKYENQKLKQMLNQDSNNSGMPTSKTPINSNKRIPNTREKTNKTKGGQIGHKRHQLERFKDEEITDTYIHEVVRCTCGCEKLKDLGIRTTKDNYDIDIRVQKIRNEFHNYKCMCCGKIIESPVPLWLKEENQYGSNIKAIAISLINEGCVSFNRTKKLISGFTNNEINMSESFMVKLQKKCYEKLTSFNNELKVKLINEKVINWDDTAININTKQGCLRYYGTEKIALYTAHERKNKEGIDEDNILNNLSKETVVVHDHNTVNYNNDYEFENAECCVHLIRDLKKVEQELSRTWAKELIELLIKTNEERKKYIEDNIYFENKYIDEVIERYDNIINQAREINKKDYNKYYGSEEKALINRLIKYKANYLMWVVRFDVPFDNNLSERSLRMSKTKMKVSGQFANIKNATYYASIKSYIETCKRNGFNEHIAIVRLLNDNPYTIDEILKNSDNQ